MAKILIVDDSDVLRMELREALESGGYEVVEGVNGLDGIAKAKENKDISLLISDVNMPEMDGISMCKAIHSDPEFTSVPKFVLTTEASAELKAAGKDAGVMLWIVKPFNKEKVLSVVAKVLSQKVA
jgi:two-component system, chemotaxis family, chemotaxis protein CheY